MITVYSKSNCPFCDRAKALLESHGVEYTTVSVEEDTDARQRLLDMGLRSVPQIFKGTALLPGGYQGIAGKGEEFWTELKN
jgi:glutaredoxin-related protein